MKTALKAPDSKRLKLKCDTLLSSFAFNFNLRHYTKEAVGGGDLKAKMQKDFNKKAMENFVMQLPISMTEFCLSHSFLMWNSMTQSVGVDIFPPDHRYLAFKPGVCFGFAPLSVSATILVGRCRLTVSKPELIKARLISEYEYWLETKM
jgi:hypothetical protein